MGKLWAWFMGWWDAEDRTKDVKLLAFAFVVFWSSLKLAFSKITSEWVEAFMWLCALVGGGGAVWTAVEKWRGGKGANQPAKGPGATGEGGEA